MSLHRATIDWKLASESFDYEAYNREHTWSFEGGQTVAASAAPDFLGSADRVDPEEAFVAAISSCHMLTFLAIASKRGLVVEEYRDEAVGYLEAGEDRRLAVTRVELRPRIRFAGDRAPEPGEIARIHEKSHTACFIANSVKTQVSVIHD